MDHAQLESRVDSWPPELALVVAIAAKASTLFALAGRFPAPGGSRIPSSVPSSGTTTPTNNLGPAPDAEKAARDVAAARFDKLRAETAQDATTWLSRVCAHIGVDLDQLPDALDPQTKLPLPSSPFRRADAKEKESGAKDEAASEVEATEEQRAWEVCWELVLVSLGLVGTSAPTAQEAGASSGGGPSAAAVTEPNGKTPSAANRFAGRLGSKVGSLLAPSSSSDPPVTATGNTSSDSPGSGPAPLKYTALSRSLVLRTLAVCSIPASVLTNVEHTIAQFLFFQLQEQTDRASGSGTGKGTGTTADVAHEADRASREVGWDAAAQEYRDRAAKKGNALKWAATGAGFVLGGVAIGLTGGLAAPAIAAGLGTFGIATFSGASGAVLVGTLLGLGGGGLAGYRTHRRMKGLEEVRFEPIQDHDAHELPQIPSLTATIVASGFLLDEADSVEPWRAYVRSSRADAYALKADSRTFLEAGRSLDKYVTNRLINMGGVEVIKRTALAALYAGVALPLTVFSTATTALDSEFSRCRDKAEKAGVMLAEILEKEVQGKRPVVLMGYGPGALLIFSCLEHLHSLGLSSLVHSAILISLPTSPSRAAWHRARSVVAHELVNVWNRNDYVLAIAARLYTLSPNIAGIRPVEWAEEEREGSVRCVTNVDVSDLVGKGHLDLRNRMGEVLERVMERREEQPRTSSPPPGQSEVEGREVKSEVEAQGGVSPGGKEEENAAVERLASLDVRDSTEKPWRT